MTVWLTIFSVNRFLRLIGSKQPGPEVALLSGVDCTYLVKASAELQTQQLLFTKVTHLSTNNNKQQQHNRFNQ